MTKVIGVRFRQAGKIYFFSPGKLEIKPARPCHRRDGPRCGVSERL